MNIAETVIQSWAATTERGPGGVRGHIRRLKIPGVRRVIRSAYNPSHTEYTFPDGSVLHAYGRGHFLRLMTTPAATP